MEPKYKFKLEVQGIIGLIFTPIGLLFLILGVVIPAESISGSPALFKGVFIGFGLLFAILGGALLSYTVRKNLRIKKVVESGNFIMADFMQSTLNTAITVNGRNPYVAEFQYTDPYGAVHIYRSRDLFSDPAQALAGKQVRVYVDADNDNNYYVDIDSVLKIH